MKNVVRLNEQQLNRIIAESVKRVISEMDEADWKTYANAANKAQERGEYERAEKFRAQRDKEFNNNYGFTSGYEVNPDGSIQVAGKQVSASGGASAPFLSAQETYNVSDDGVETRYANENGIYNNVNVRRRGNLVSRTPREGLSHLSPEIQAAYGKAKTEIDNYKNGNYTYDNQRGWQLNK